MFLIHRHGFPQGTKFTYSRIFCDIWPHKKETHRVQLTVRGDTLTFFGPVSTPIIDLITSKLHWKRFISIPGAKYLVVNVNNFYLNKPVVKYEYYKIALILISEDVIDNKTLCVRKSTVFSMLGWRRECMG